MTGNELMPDYKDVNRDENAYERLKSHGHVGESFDDLDSWKTQQAAIEDSDE